MAISTYSELVTAIGNWLDRSDLGTVIPDFIKLAESRIYHGDGELKGLRLRSMEQRATRDMVTGTELYGLPSDFLEMRNISYTRDNRSVDLVYRTPTQLDEHFTEDINGYPEAFSIEGTELRLRPIPSGTWEMEQVYYKQFDALSAGSPTNDILTNFPGIYLFGALAESEGYLKNDPRIQVWDARFIRMMAAANQSNEVARRQGGAKEAVARNIAHRAFRI